MSYYNVSLNSAREGPIENSELFKSQSFTK